MTDTSTPCLMCGAGALEELFDLGVLPAGFPVPADRSLTVWSAPLVLAICRNCSLVQTVHRPPDDLLLSETFYTSRRSQAIAEHDRRFADAIVDRRLATPDSLVLEIGCSDGSLLTELVARGLTRVVGVEPSPHADATYPCEVVSGVFDARLRERLQAEGRSPDLVIVNHVIDGLPNPAEFVAEVARLMKPSAALIVEVPDVVDLIDGLRLDAFAHSRNSWFTVGAFVHAFTAVGLRIDEIEHEHGYRGGTLRVFVRKAPAGPRPSSAASLLAREAVELSAEKFAEFRLSIARHRTAILAELHRVQDGRCYVYGAGLKAATVVNWLGLGTSDVVSAVDNDPRKQGRVIPLAGIPIEPVDTLWRLHGPATVLHLALDHSSEVEQQLMDRLPAGSTIAYPLPVWRQLQVGVRDVEFYE